MPYFTARGVWFVTTLLLLVFAALFAWVAALIPAGSGHAYLIATCVWLCAVFGLMGCGAGMWVIALGLDWRTSEREDV